MTTDKEWVQVLDHTSPSFVFLCSLYLTEFRGPFIVFIAIIFFSFTSFFFLQKKKSKALVVLDNSHSWGRHLSGFCAPNPHMQPPNGSAPRARVCLNLAPMPTINIKSNKTILSFLFTQNKTKQKSRAPTHCSMTQCQNLQLEATWLSMWSQCLVFYTTLLCHHGPPLAQLNH